MKPDYSPALLRDVHRIQDGMDLVSSANISDIGFGTGASIYKDSILPELEKAVSEVILVTCFWAASETRDALNASLLRLSNAALQRGTKVRVRICFSSSSLIQKLFHTSAISGQTYSAYSWHKHLGLARSREFAGLDLEVKSIFFRPFSVMHPKFVILDRKLVFLPSCNVSWEDWFEGYMRLDGPIVDHFFNFWKTFWASPRDRDSCRASTCPSTSSPVPENASTTTQCVFLPSPHSINPRFRLPWQSFAPPPQTPLNLFLLSAFESAKKEIFLQTPNITSPPVLDALLDALQRGVHISVTTSERLMILEQLVTAGTTTARCVKLLAKRYTRVVQHLRDEEQGLLRPGHLQISYYTPRRNRGSHRAEPSQSHVKLTVIDDEVVVFGSGNMDRASWYTSQELGVAFYSSSLATEVKRDLTSAMQGRVTNVFSRIRNG